MNNCINSTSASTMGVRSVASRSPAGVYETGADSPLSDAKGCEKCGLQETRWGPEVGADNPHFDARGVRSVTSRSPAGVYEAGADNPQSDARGCA